MPGRAIRAVDLGADGGEARRRLGPRCSAQAGLLIEDAVKVDRMAQALVCGRHGASRGACRAFDTMSSSRTMHTAPCRGLACPLVACHDEPLQEPLREYERLENKHFAVVARSTSNDTRDAPWSWLARHVEGRRMRQVES